MKPGDKVRVGGDPNVWILHHFDDHRTPHKDPIAWLVRRNGKQIQTLCIRCSKLTLLDKDAV